MPAGRWLPWDGLVLPLVVLALIVVLDAGFGPEIILSGTYGIAAVAASAITTVRRTAIVAAATLVCSIVSGAWNDNFGTLDWVIRVSFTVGLGVLAVVSAQMRVHREQALQRMTVIAETAQRAVLRAMPTAVGSVEFAARYLSASQEALVGGDLYDVTSTPYGVRVIVGDVRGKGLEAVQMAAAVLAAFRTAAFHQPSMTAIAAHLDNVVKAVAGEEDFVTAVLAEFHDDHTVTLVNCGHHAPVLIAPSDGTIDVATGTPALPLGLGADPVAVTSSWSEDTRMLIYTDGLIETRDDHGNFFSLADNAAALRAGNLEEALDNLLARLLDFAGDRLTDDMALVLAEHGTIRPSRSALA
jgi:phosphoserine phosphatase RsbU/P